MDKSAIVQQLCEQIKSDRDTLTQAALAAHEAATHTESKAEDQYDTRGLEASYLAGAQSKRALELEEILVLFRETPLRQFTDANPVSLTAVVEVQCEGKSHYYFLMPKGGGMQALVEGKTVFVITPHSPIGETLIGRHVGDDFELRIQSVERSYAISRIW
ncbi:MAG: GreA/GreB family elongation factor [Deltaproteobacteria bacterium]|nr:GreA/GreB family elongation factor [Deltaproteobacteria bacterium]MBI3294522.1 GreA/GreB family elongation factor [Deltaproteobacteria bacterium]